MILNYRKENVFAFDKYRLQPGINDLPDLKQDQWKELLDGSPGDEKTGKKPSGGLPKLKMLVDNGDIEVVDSGFDATNPNAFTDGGGTAGLLNSKKEKDAIALVKQTADLNLLNTWLVETKSSNVKKEIEKQIDVVQKAGEQGK